RELDTEEPPTARASRRFVDREPATVITSARAATEVQTEPVYRPSLTELTGRPSLTELRPPAALDDDALPDETSFDELQIESAQMAAVSPDEPIDDDLGSMSTAAIADRRRTVVVFGLVEGTSSMTRDAMRPVTRSLGELAYQRGGVVLALDDDGLLVGFGLEVAGEDDVAIAMGWALDASSLARETAGAVLKIGARTGVATTAASDGVTRVPQDASDEARALAREAAPDRPLFVGGAGRVTSNLYALREVPAPRRSDAGSRSRIPRRSRVIEVVGPRGFAERDRARLERKSKLVGRVHQLAEIEAWLARAITANRRLVTLVVGAAGTGKSRLVAEMIARHPELRVTSTAASPASRLAPFSLVIDLYQAALALAPARGRGARAQLVHRLIHLMTKAGATLDRARVIAVDLDRAMELRDGVSVGAPEVADLRPRISAGLAAFRETMLEGTTALTIIEDLHLADTASLEVMRHTLAVPAQGPELLLLTSRGDHSPPPPVDAIITV
ncbi:MAG TPA: AAA family ATPase, partial [Kofleriaceae bacterium]|nr:AAA family ATPase [Kofleriaceae bacterium]